MAIVPVTTARVRVLVAVLEEKKCHALEYSLLPWEKELGIFIGGDEKIV